MTDEKIEIELVRKLGLHAEAKAMADLYQGDVPGERDKAWEFIAEQKEKRIYELLSQISEQETLDEEAIHKLYVGATEVQIKRRLLRECPENESELIADKEITINGICDFLVSAVLDEEIPEVYSQRLRFPTKSEFQEVHAMIELYCTLITEAARGEYRFRLDKAE